MPSTAPSARPPLAPMRFELKSSSVRQRPPPPPAAAPPPPAAARARTAASRTAPPSPSLHFARRSTQSTERGEQSSGASAATPAGPSAFSERMSDTTAPCEACVALRGRASDTQSGVQVKATARDGAQREETFWRVADVAWAHLGPSDDVAWAHLGPSECRRERDYTRRRDAVVREIDLFGPRVVFEKTCECACQGQRAALVSEARPRHRAGQEG